MIEISEVATGVLVGAIGTTGRWLATAARAPRGRKAEDLGIARWFETYKLTATVPDLPSTDAERLAEALRGPEIQAAVQELLAARLTDAPETDAARARDAFCLTLTLALPAATAFAGSLADFYDEQIGALVARLEASEPALLAQIRSEAMSARMIAVLHAIERHTAALTSASRDAGTFLAGYRRQVIEQHGKLQPPDFDRRRRVPLADIYVPAVIYKDFPSERIMASPQPPPSLTVWELADRADRSVLLGDPGGGKTTASNVLMHYFASDPTGRIPFLVTLRDFARDTPPTLSVVGHIERELETLYQCPAPPGLVNMLLLTGRAIVFFDGLDELLDTSRRSDVATRVELFCTEYPLAPVLVTSRVVGYDQARLDDCQFTCYRLGGFTDEDVADYARKWFSLDSDTRPDEADAFISESESVPDLRSNPLLLSLMCILYRGEGSLPRNRAEIYEQCSNLLFRKWDARRRIHQDLRAGHLVEPALRHLAWWLFTREDTHSAVTERELINATTEFLHGRGFESLDDAREAAKEFIEFCRGRMWVFSDTGTTATGENLYSFTHRTFLEYFAAAQLAYNSDTPEKLARTLAPHIAKGEWEVVGELAVQIKDNTSTEGAERVYETLLNERRRRTQEGRSGILQFLARSLRSVGPPPQIIRQLTREVVSVFLSKDLDSETFSLPVCWLIGSQKAIAPIIAEEVQVEIDTAVASGDHATHLNGLRFSMYVDNALRAWGDSGPKITQNSWLNDYWASQKRESTKRHSKLIAAAATRHADILNSALRNGVIDLDQALRGAGDLQPLLRNQDQKVFNIMWVAYLPNTVEGLIRYPGDAGLSAEMISVAQHIAGLSGPPWAAGPVHSYAYGKMIGTPDPDHRHLAPDVYFGAAAIILISIEGSRDEQSRIINMPDILGPLSELTQYIRLRHSPGSGLQLSDLPVPDEFKQIFRDWAAGKINFVEDSPDNS